MDGTALHDIGMLCCMAPFLTTMSPQDTTSCTATPGCCKGGGVSNPTQLSHLGDIKTEWSSVSLCVSLT